VEPIPEPDPKPNKKTARAKRQPKRPPAPALATAASIAEETRLIGRARKALGTGDNAAALAIAAEHAQQFPSGQFTQEREAVRTRAHCNRGDANAQNAAEKFLAKWPKSPYAAKVRGSCKLEN
jgi:outer membrane protein assembly factor BamD (BamD/ComL family)